MNKTQRNVLVTAILVFVVMGSYPPWTLDLIDPKSEITKRAYGPLFAPPTHPANCDERAVKSVSIDYNTLLFQWLLLGAATAGLYWVDAFAMIKKSSKALLGATTVGVNWVFRRIRGRPTGGTSAQGTAAKP